MSKKHKQKEDLEQADQDIKKEINQYKEGWLRARADYDNLQKETDKWKQDFIKYANNDLLLELLPVYSHYKLALQHIPEEDRSKDWVQGIINIFKLLQNFMAKMGVTEIKTVGEKFDPMLHEAVGYEQDEAKEDDLVLEEVQPGYQVDGRVLQPAKVKVNNLDTINQSESDIQDKESASGLQGDL